MPAPELWLLVMARDPAGAKSRLAAVLDERSRAALAIAMLADVLAATGSTAVARRIVATESDAIGGVARAAGAEVLDVPRSDTNEAAAAALRHARVGGAAGALVLAADLPLLRPDDVGALIEASEGADVVIAPDRHDRGTNAIVLRPPLVIAPAFGRDSRRAHEDRARRAGLRVRVVRRHGLAVDVDDAADLDLARGDPALGRRTRDHFRESTASI